MSSVKRISFGILIILLSVALLVSCSGVEPVQPTQTATATWTPLPTHTPTPTATPTPTTNLFLDAAEQAEFNGDWDRALAGYDQADRLVGIARQLGIASQRSDDDVFPTISRRFQVRRLAEEVFFTGCG